MPKTKKDTAKSEKLEIKDLAIVHIYGQMGLENTDSGSTKAVLRDWDRNCANLSASTCMRNVRLTTVEKLRANPFPSRIKAEIVESLEGVDAYKFLLEWTCGIKNLKGQGGMADNRVGGEFYSKYSSYETKGNKDISDLYQGLQEIVIYTMTDITKIRSIWSNPDLSKGRKTGELVEATLNACANCAHEREGNNVPNYKIMELPKSEYIAESLKETLNNHKTFYAKEVQRSGRLSPANRTSNDSQMGEMRQLDRALSAVLARGSRSAFTEIKSNELTR
jgi:hypothetical protein